MSYTDSQKRKKLKEFGIELPNPPKRKPPESKYVMALKIMLSVFLPQLYES